MENIRAEQIEALEVMIDYLPKLKNAMNNVAGELTGTSYPDTAEYLRKTIDGLNWVIGIFNGTRELINEKEVKLDKEVVNKDILAFGEAYKSKDNSAVASFLTGALMNFVNSLETAAKEIISDK